MARPRPKALIAWSSGKDSAWALHEARRAGDFDIVGALTTVTDSFARVSMHGVREELLRAQLEAAGLPAIVVRIPYPCPNEIYEREMAAAMRTPRRAASRILFSAISSWRTCAPIASRSLPAPASRRCFRLWQTADRAAGARHDRRRRRGASRDGRSEEVAGIVRRPPFRCGLARATCRPASIPAARTANSIPSCRPGRC